MNSQNRLLSGRTLAGAVFAVTTAASPIAFASTERLASVTHQLVNHYDGAAPSADQSLASANGRALHHYDSTIPSANRSLASANDRALHHYD